MNGLLISGACGRMGRMIAQEAGSHGFTVLAGVDPTGEQYDRFPVYRHLRELLEKPDMLIDFSSPATLTELLEYAVNNKVPCVLGTTGYTAQDLQRIQAASAGIPVFQSPNMSRGVYVLKQLAALAARMLPGYDIEIIEKHHNQKADSPSGTALALLEATKKPDTLPVFGREGRQTKRKQNEIGLHAVRGGTVAGEHEVGYYGSNEVLTLSHHAQSRGVFAEGALAAAAWLINQQPGLYGMADFMETK